MKIKIFFAAVIILLPLQAFTQNLVPGKDLAFAHIAVGATDYGQYVTVLTVTNRGVTPYLGTLSLFRSSGEAWNPWVNGSQITNGTLNVGINPGITTSWSIMGSECLLCSSADLEVGYGVIKASTVAQRSFIEGSLTYSLYDAWIEYASIPVPPSGETYLTTVPFRDFNSVALALANYGDQTAQVTLSLFPALDPLGVRGTVLNLDPKQHVAKYLSEIFPGVSLPEGRLDSMPTGRVDIQSNVPILGTALAGWSSLPMLPAVKAYQYVLDFPGMSISGHLSLRINGTAVEGYAVEDSDTSPDIVHIQGKFVDGMIEIDMHETGDQPYLQCLRIGPFDLSMKTVAGSVKMWNLVNPPDYAGEGLITLTAIN